MKTIIVKRKLIEEALEHLMGAQRDKYVLSTQNVIDELKIELRQPDIAKSNCIRCEREKETNEIVKHLCYRCLKEELENIVLDDVKKSVQCTCQNIGEAENCDKKCDKKEYENSL